MDDVLIVGAGAAGLEAARHFKRAGLSFKILEARPEVGGRARGAGLHPEIELGAEFIHGEAPLTKRRLAIYGLGFQAVEPDFHIFTNERLRASPQYWKILESALSHLRRTREDRPFDAFLAAADLTETERLISAAFIEGFDAAELGRAGANELVGVKKIVSDPRERALARPDLGYSPLFAAMAEGMTDSIRLRTIVREIEWDRGSVVVRADGIAGRRTFRARTALITVPIGVLKSPPSSPGAIHFNPEVPGLFRALERVEMGHVVRLGLEFAPEVRALFDAKFPRGFPFIASPGLDYTMWWARDSSNRPTITAWAGGDHARRLAPLGHAERIEIALGNLARIVGVQPSTLAHGLRQAHHHDWSQNPFARGAYAYLGLGGENAPDRLRRSVRQTLYFAGEALEVKGGGTVEAALASGKRQSQKIVSRLGKRKAGSAIRRSRPTISLSPNRAAD